jgi:hypothetical protein
MQCERFIPLWRCASISEASLSRGWLYRFFFRRQEMFTIMAASTATKAVCPTKGVRRIGFQFHRVVTAQEEPKTSFTVTPKRICKFQFISLHFCGQSTFRTYDFRTLLEIGNFNLRRVAASLAFDWELSVAKEIRFHFPKTFNAW